MILGLSVLTWDLGTFSAEFRTFLETFSKDFGINFLQNVRQMGEAFSILISVAGRLFGQKGKCLLHFCNPTRSLRSCDKLLLVVPKIHTALPRRSFSHAAPTIWNSLPFLLRNASSLHSFTTQLKTNLFPP